MIVENFSETNISHKIRDLIKPEVESQGMELVDVEYKMGPKQFLRILVDKSGGVTHSDCGKISSKISEVLDMEDIIDSKYVLEVSSPGLNRPLKSEADFKRNKGNLVKISLLAPLEGKFFF